jgi:hypothetical protein
MSQSRATDHGPSEGQPWPPESTAGQAEALGADTAVRALEPNGLRTTGAPRAGTRRGQRRPRPAPRAAIALPLAGDATLTALGVSIVLSGACLFGATVDLLLVGTAAWAMTLLFLGASGFAAAKVRRSDWYSAVVGPPLAFAGGLTLVSLCSPRDLGAGVMGVIATMLELLALKARVVFTGTGLALAVTLVRRLQLRR